MLTIAVAAFYRFLPLSHPDELRDRLEAACMEGAVKGTLLLAPEGLNGTLAGPPDSLRAVLDVIREAAGCPDLTPRFSVCEGQPFARLKVRVKREIVTFGRSGVDPARRTGTPVAPKHWNSLLDDPAIPVIDVRNSFEHAIGSFTGAVDPGTRAFGEFPAFVTETLDPNQHRSVAMFCTGGIRCEKASAYMLEQGFETVYQLEGGILAYLAEVPAAESRYQGGCFVFDERGSLDAGLVPSPVTLCRMCSWPLPAATGETLLCDACSESLKPIP